MIGRRSIGDEQVLRDLLEHLNAEAPQLSEHALAAAARRATTEPRRPQQRRATEDRSRPWRPLRLRWSLAAAAAILLATGLGFGFGTWLTPSGSAREPVVGLGFLSAKGWTVVQSGSTGSAESAVTAAANVPFAPADRPGARPLTTLRSLPPGGIVIVATLRTRGDPAVDALFPVRRPPLRLADAEIEALTQYRLRAGVGGYNVDARVTFGSEPTPGMFREAEEQIARLVVAPAAVTIAVRPTIYGPSRPLTVYGSVTNGKADEKVTVQFKQCGLYPTQFRDHAEVATLEGGGWSIDTGVAANGVFRAVTAGDVSNEVQVLKRADVRLSPTRSGRYRAYVVERASFWRKRVLIQRFDRGRGKWLKVKTLVLVDSSAAPGSTFVWSSTEKFKLNVPKGTTIQAVLPLDQAKPCHIAGYSNLLRT